MVLPSGFALPPLPYLFVLLLAVGVVGGTLWRVSPPVGERTVVAFAPWIVVGSGLHALYQVRLPPAVVEPLLGTPAVYLTTFAVAGTVWLAVFSLSSLPVARTLAVTGIAAVLPVVGLGVQYGVANGSLRLFWPFVGLVTAVVLTGLLWGGTRYLYPDVAVVTGAVGALVLFGHSLDAVSTAVGIDVLNFGERTPVSRLILEFAHGLPTADVIGVGWLFVLVKVALAEFIVVLFADYVAEEPTEGYLLLGLVAAVGLGPGAYNLLLFAIAPPV
ncbi:DUF63 family protein [Halomicrococcus sp. SG-WS-1]|uniref:DUF63 family protein n=1 Tax=Halomicrococcus sp. SG-WS-1 TaxID=3439057 RepID=UPI003F78E64F